MLNESEIIESGFAALRSSQPKLQAVSFVGKVRRQELRARIQRVTLALSGCIAVATLTGIVLRPTSALAALTESAKLSGGQPLIHIQFDTKDEPANPASPPWPQRPPEDIWKFKDRYIRKLGSNLTVQFRDGRMISYDSRFPFGFRSTYEADKDQFWKFNGTVGIDFRKLFRNPPEVSETRENGVSMLDYTWQEDDAVGHHKVEHVFVDPQSKLVRSSRSVTTSVNGDLSSGTAQVDYPHSNSSPAFPSGVVFKSQEELVQDFSRRIQEAEQSRSVGGVSVTLYGVIAHTNVPDGIGIQVVTTGGGEPDYGSDHSVEVLGEKQLPVKRLDWLHGIGDLSRVRLGREQAIGGRTYLVNQSNDLLLKAPLRVTVRVPVWRAKSHDFIGYVTFTTSKIFYAVGNWDYCSAVTR